MIIGGGIVGQFIAYYLSKSSHEVTIIDDGPSMLPASAGNCGLITPSHIEPLNSFSTLIQGIKWLGKKDAPLAIKPQLDPAFIKWFLAFVWHSRRSSVRKSIAVRHELLQTSWKLYQEYFNSEKSTCGFRKDGLVYAANSKQGFESLRREVELLRSNNLSCDLLSKEELLEKENALNHDMVGGSIFHVDGWLRPDQLLEEVRGLNASNGVNLVYGKVKDFICDKKGVTGLRTEKDEVKAGKFILAAGALSYCLARKLDISLPMIPGKGYNLTYSSKLPNQPKFPIYMVEKKVVATPWDNGFRLGSTMEFTGFDLTLNQSRLTALKRASKEYLTTDIEHVEPVPWAGWRPMTSNSLPIIKQSEKYKNLILATGHGMLGLSMAPATGKIVASLVDP